ncbi:MAG TPA: hypothetical protein VMB18_15320 [Terriglobales bacterium]|jgi:hypothetical protein|nr:hypothetical protein [Terriglobales bacterium]
MRSRILLTILLTGLFVIASGCGNVKNCPVCGTTTADGYADIVNITVPEHNPTGEPGGPFNSFDITWINTPTHLGYTSDRIGLAVVVFDTVQNLAVNAIQGSNAVTDAGNAASPCVKDAAGNDIIPPVVDVVGNFIRFACRTDMSTATPPGPTFHLISGFGANHNFGGFPGAQCCASRANGVNPMSGPDGEEVTPDGKTLFTAIGAAQVAVFDLTTTPPTVIALIPTGTAGDYDGPLGIGPCISSWNGEAGSAATCGDDRADEMAYDPTHQVLAVINGDPGFPFVTLIDVSHVVNKTGTVQQQHCLPIDQTLAYGPYEVGWTPSTYPLQGSGTAIPQPSPTLDPGVTGTSFNPPSCIIGQIYYDGAGGAASSGLGLNSSVPVDTAGGGFPCPDPSNPHVFSGVSGGAANAAAGLPGLGGITPTGGSYTIACHHGPLLDQTLGTFCSQTTPGSNCAGAIAPAGLGGMVWNENTGMLLQANENAIPITNIGTIDVINPRLGNPNGPVVVNSFPIPNCMPTSIVQGPGNNFLVGCADHDGEAFPPNEYIIDGTAGTILAQITNVGGVDEVWYNPGDNRYYLAARDMPNGPVMGVIDAGSMLWLQNVTTNSNSHSIAVDSSNNHAFVPLQAGGICTSQSSNGCIGVYAQQ